MTSISFLILEGIISPPDRTSCSLESQSIPGAHLEKKYITLSPERITALIKYFQQTDLMGSPLYWKNQAIAHMATASSIVSLSFIPKETQKCHRLFIQKMDLSSEIRGFIAPYLSPLERAQWKATDNVSACMSIYDKNAIQDSIQGLPEKVKEEVSPILKCFLNDNVTVMLSMTYLDQSGSCITVSYHKV